MRKRPATNGALPVTTPDVTRSVPPPTDKVPEPRFCRFAEIYCRCGLEPIETATMSVCARHYMHEVVSDHA